MSRTPSGELSTPYMSVCTPPSAYTPPPTSLLHVLGTLVSHLSSLVCRCFVTARSRLCSSSRRLRRPPRRSEYVLPSADASDPVLITMCRLFFTLQSSLSRSTTTARRTGPGSSRSSLYSASPGHLRCESSRSSFCSFPRLRLRPRPLFLLPSLCLPLLSCTFRPGQEQLEQSTMPLLSLARRILQRVMPLGTPSGSQSRVPVNQHLTSGHRAHIISKLYVRDAQRRI